MNLIPRSLFARLMAIWLLGIALVLAASFALFVGERERVGRAALFEGVAQEVATTADVLDHLGPPMYSQPNSNTNYYGGFDIGRFVYMKYQQNF